MTPELTRGEVAQLRDRDPRIVAHLEVPGIVTRLRRWIDAGEPAPNLDSGPLQFRGTDWARDLVIGVLRQVPLPVAWHGFEFVVWREVGSVGGGQRYRSFAPRHPPGDQSHDIDLCGRAHEESLKSSIAHELGHSWAADIVPAWLTSGVVRHLPEREIRARRLLIARDIGMTAQDLSNRDADDEVLADSLSTIWGYERGSSHSSLAYLFAREYTDAEPLANKIAEDLKAAARSER